MKSEIRSESDGESEVEGKVTTCQSHDCDVKRVNYDDVSCIYRERILFMFLVFRKRQIFLLSKLRR